MTSEFYSFANGTRDGYNARVSIHYCFNEIVAIGAEYNSFFGGKSSADILFQLADSSMVTGKIVDDARLRWLGFSILLRPTSLGKATFSASFGAGPLFYKNNATYLNNFTLTGTTIAFNAKV